jgi:hypothetical protein
LSELDTCVKCPCKVVGDHSDSHLYYVFASGVLYCGLNFISSRTRMVRGIFNLQCKRCCCTEVLMESRKKHSDSHRLEQEMGYGWHTDHK